MTSERRFLRSRPEGQNISARKKGGEGMAEEKYICRKCGWEFVAIPGEEEPPECPECASDEIEKLELATFGRTAEPK